MRRVPIEELKTGDRLGRDVYSAADSLPLLRAGVRLSDSYVQALRRATILSVWVDDVISEGIEPLEILEEATKRRATIAIQNAFKNVASSVPKNGGRVSSETAKEMEEVAEMIIRDISRNVHSALALNDLANADGYTLKHSLAVTTLGLSIGMRVMHKHGWIDAHGKRRFDDIEGRLAPLGVGLLLHDIGKLAVPHDILHKPGALTKEEFETVKGHPMLGFQMLVKADGISPLARAVVRSHHERWDGSGYPEAKAGAAIHQFARIASPADVFDALTSDRSYRKAMPMDKGYDLVLQGAGSQFDPEVVDIFRTFVAPYPPGTNIVLSDGRAGLVKEVRPEAVTRPIVRILMDASQTMITPEEIDLSRSPELTIVSTQVEFPALEPA
jgi:HD-GYP domain-containing protein (c-di-GMP phosphodiesterase class II)